MALTTVVTIALVPVLIFALWHITSTTLPPIPSLLHNKRIILLIAHPDDESMFFSPTLQALTNPSLQNHLKILCLSTGDADGLGATRRLELGKGRGDARVEEERGRVLPGRRAVSRRYEGGLESRRRFEGVGQCLCAAPEWIDDPDQAVS